MRRRRSAPIILMLMALGLQSKIETGWAECTLPESPNLLQNVQSHLRESDTIAKVIGAEKAGILDRFYLLDVKTERDGTITAQAIPHPGLPSTLWRNYLNLKSDEENRSFQDFLSNIEKSGSRIPTDQRLALLSMFGEEWGLKPLKLSQLAQAFGFECLAVEGDQDEFEDRLTHRLYVQNGSTLLQFQRGTANALDLAKAMLAQPQGKAPYRPATIEAALSASPEGNLGSTTSEVINSIYQLRLSANGDFLTTLASQSPSGTTCALTQVVKASGTEISTSQGLWQANTCEAVRQSAPKINVDPIALDILTQPPHPPSDFTNNSPWTLSPVKGGACLTTDVAQNTQLHIIGAVNPGSALGASSVMRLETNRDHFKLGVLQNLSASAAPANLLTLGQGMAYLEYDDIQTPVPKLSITLEGAVTSAGAIDSTKGVLGQVRAQYEEDNFNFYVLGTTGEVVIAPQGTSQNLTPRLGIDLGGLLRVTPFASLGMDCEADNGTDPSDFNSITGNDSTLINKVCKVRYTTQF